ncbi:MAG: multidrug effflux MFS transporter [Burkholderiales bacterium]|nr:multidrug effflux MFS transporter [Burkholderiales bacterium]
MLGPFAVDMYLPAFGAIQTEFGVAPIAMQQTLSAYMIAYAVMMLWHGALADALGRRPVVLGGLGIFALGTLGCAIAGNIESLWLARVLQGISAGGGVVVGRAIIRDRFQGAEAQRMMSHVTLVFGIGPAVAPILGGILLNILGWRSVFWFLFAYTLTMLVVCARHLPETLPVAMRQPLHPAALWRSYRTVLGRPAFLFLALVTSLSFCGWFLYIASAPYFLSGLLGVSTLGFGWLFIPMISGIMGGAFVSGRIAGRLSTQRTVNIGLGIMAGGALLNVAICHFLPPGVLWNIAPILVCTLGWALAMPSITLTMLDLFPALRGMTASLQGFAQFALGAVVAGSISPLLTHSLPGLAWAMLAFIAASSVSWLVYRRHVRLRQEISA